MRPQRSLLFFLALFLVPALSGNVFSQGSGDYWNDVGGGFNTRRTSMNYQRSSYFLAGGDYENTSGGTTSYDALFSVTPDYVFDPSVAGDRANHLYRIPNTSAEVAFADPALFRVENGKVQTKMSTFYLSMGDFTNGTAGYNDQYDLHQNYLQQASASDYAKQAPSGDEAIGSMIWLTPYGQLKDYMLAGPAKDQWATDANTLSSYEKSTVQAAVKNFSQGDNPYNRAAASLGMLNGAFGNEVDPDINLGFGNFYRVADIWVNAEDVARTSLQSSWKSDQIQAPGSYNISHRRPELVADQRQDFGYWGPESTRNTDPHQVSWHHSMENLVTLHIGDDGSGRLLTAIRHGLNMQSVALSAIEVGDILTEHGLPSGLKGTVDLLQPLWSSNDNYSVLQTAFYPLWWEMNTKTGVFPWTGHGFTYDWYYGWSDTDYSAMTSSTDWSTNAFSEFIVRPGADFEVIQTMELVEYLTGVPATYQPRTIPEPAALLLALVGFALLPGRRRR